MKTSTKTVALITLATLTAGSAVAQSYLPPRQNHAVKQHLKARNLRAALNAALNSPGDTITFDLMAGITVSPFAGANLGHKHAFEVELSYAKNAFEVRISYGQAVSMGIEAFEGLEVNAGAGFQKGVLFRFPDKAQAERGMRAMAITRALRVDRLMKASHKVMTGLYSGFIKARSSWWKSVSSLRLGRTTERVMKNSYETARRFLYRFYYPLRTARIRFQNALSNVRRLDAKARSARTRAGRRFYSRLASVARRILGPLTRALRSAENRYRYKIDELNSKKQKWYAAAARVRQLVNSEIALRNSKHWAWDRYAKAREAFKKLSTPATVIGGLIKGVEFEVYATSDLSAAVSLPGVSLENFGLGASASTKVDGKVRFDFRNGSEPARITVGAGINAGIAATAGAGLGARATIDQGLAMQASWIRYGRTGRFQREAMKVAVEVDMTLQARAGIGFTKIDGVGRTIRLEMTAPQWATALKRAPRLTSNPKAHLATALRGMRVTQTTQDRWLSGGRVGVAVSVLGVGAFIEGGVLWQDRGAVIEHSVTGTTALAQIGRAGYLSNVAKKLGQ